MSADQVGIISKAIAENSCSTTNSQRKLAVKAGCSKASIGRVLKNVIKKKPLRKVKTTKNCKATLAKRQSVAAGLTTSFESGEIDIDSVFFPDETRVDLGVAYRANSKNDVVYVDAYKKKDDVIDQLEVGKQQRHRGLMLHHTVSSFGGGMML